MLTATPTHWFNWDFTVYDGDRAVATIDLASLREAGELEVDGAGYELRREHWMGGRYSLHKDGWPVAEAEKPSAFYRRFEITYQSRTYVLRAPSAVRRAFVLEKDDKIVGTIAPEGIFTRRMRIDLPDALPLPVQTFLVWLVVLMWRRAARNN